MPGAAMGDATRSERGQTLPLWFGVLAAPAAWSLQLLISAELPELACAADATDPTVFGLSVETFILLSTGVLAAVAVLGAVVSYRCWRRTGVGEQEGSRPRWMGLAGILTSLLFLILMLPGFLPAVFLSQCGRPL